MFPLAAPAFRPSHIRIGTAADEREIRAAFALRRDVFCTEQGLFEQDDRDALDERAMMIVAATTMIGMTDEVVGTVRIHEHAPRRWTGSRLAIRADYRGVAGVGAHLVRRAVGTAVSSGCVEFTATVQRQNVPFFRRLGWEPLEACIIAGYPHVAMSADLAAHPPADGSAAEFLFPERRAS
ncbi:MAG: hypothetical protein NVSMB64_11240 [Candidatus Velthaea sp.]